MRLKHVVWLLVHLLFFLGGYQLSKCTEPLWANVGYSLVSAGITGAVIYVYMFITTTTAERLKAIDAAGIKKVFAHRSVQIRDEYQKRLSKAKHSIDIFGFGLRSLREDFSGQYQKWTATAKVRILLIDPAFPSDSASLANARDLEEGNPTGSIESDVKAFIRDVAPLLRNSERKLFVRLYRIIPSVNLFRIDDELFWGPYLVNTQSRNTPTILVSRSGYMFHTLADHFDHIWSDDRFSKAVPPEWLESK
jgi:hypothetical protein